MTPSSVTWLMTTILVAFPSVDHRDPGRTGRSEHRAVARSRIISAVASSTAFVHTRGFGAPHTAFDYSSPTRSSPADRFSRRPAPSSPCGMARKSAGGPPPTDGHRRFAPAATANQPGQLRSSVVSFGSGHRCPPGLTRTADGVARRRLSARTGECTPASSPARSISAGAWHWPFGAAAQPAARVTARPHRLRSAARVHLCTGERHHVCGGSAWASGGYWVLCGPQYAPARTRR